MKLTNKKTLFFLIIIVLISAIIRLWNLGNVPPSLDWDEASWGYNAYSILQTGRDEYGKFLPVVLRSFNDYKPALYAYLELPFISVLGLTAVAVRIPNAIFGVLTVLTTYFLVLEIFKKRNLALLSAFLLSISPWSIQFSRFSHEGIVGLEFNLLMILFFLKGLKKPWFLCLSAASAAISLYSYQNEKLFVPILGLVLLIVFGKELFKLQKKYLINAFIVGLVVSLPIIYFTFTNPASFTRAKGTNILNNPVGVLNTQFYPERNLIDRESKDILGLFFDNRRIAYFKDIVGNYLSHFDPNTLFIAGDIKVARHQPPRMGHLYLWELPFLLLGLYFIIFGKFEKKSKSLILVWLLIVPIPASFTWDIPNAGRTINFLPTFQILTSIGLLTAYEISKRYKFYLRYLLYFIFVSFGLFNFAYYLNQYFVQYSYFNSQDFQYGYDKIIPFVQKNYSNYRKIVISNQVPLDQSYIFFLYNLKYPPEKYQKVSSDGTYKTNHFFDKYEFRDIGNLESDKTKLYISGADVYLSLPEKKILKTINFLDGTPAYVIYTGRW